MNTKLTRIPKSPVLAALLISLIGARTPAADAPVLSSGVNLAGMDRSVRPQDDFYDYANGHWLKNTPIPDDRSSVSIASQLYDRSIDQLHELIDTAAQNTAAPANSEARKIGDLYASFMDEAVGAGGRTGRPEG